MSKPTRTDKSTDHGHPQFRPRDLEPSKVVEEQEKLEIEQGKALFRAHGGKPFPVVDIPIDL